VGDTVVASCLGFGRGGLPGQRSTIASLYDRYDLYDLVAPPDTAMGRFYVEAARSNGPRVLELACGSGRLTVPMAEAGFQVVGGDLSEPMLARAREAGEERGVAIETQRLDMRDFDLGGRQFDTVFVAANSIMHLLTVDDFAGFFASVAQHLAPNGQLLLDCFVPSTALLSRPGERQQLTTATHPTLGAITVEEIVNYDPVTQISHIEWFWSTTTEQDFHVTALKLRQIYPQELPLLLKAGGFRLKERFGDFDRNPMSSSTYRQVCVCIRDDSA
jgi:2-polyprenyl-3-methyl-5-hydroxy-6-metoxy-1,4-benzoquinol methylase